MSKLRATRAHAFNKQKGRCCYCGHPMWLTDAAAFAIRQGLTRRQAEHFRCTGEHLVARCDGGKNCQNNVAAACWWCNTRRHARKQPQSPEIYRQLVQRRIAAGRWHAPYVHTLDQKCTLTSDSDPCSGQPTPIWKLSKVAQLPITLQR